LAITWRVFLHLRWIYNKLFLIYTSPLLKLLIGSKAALEDGATFEIRRRAKKPNIKAIL
jgi:hypothetical protein